MDDPTRPWGFFMCLLAVILGIAVYFHQPVTVVPPPSAIVPTCDGGDGLYYLCSDPWVPREFAV